MRHSTLTRRIDETTPEIPCYGATIPCYGAGALLLAKEQGIVHNALAPLRKLT
jgi:hypothetical protein